METPFCDICEQRAYDFTVRDSEGETLLICGKCNRSVNDNAMPNYALLAEGED